MLVDGTRNPKLQLLSLGRSVLDLRFWFGLDFQVQRGTYGVVAGRRDRVMPSMPHGVGINIYLEPQVQGDRLFKTVSGSRLPGLCLALKNPLRAKGHPHSHMANPGGI